MAEYSTIGGGIDNQIDGSSNDSTIAGGYDNLISAFAPGSTICGGWRILIGQHSAGSAIAGGLVNSIGNLAISATIGGGSNNVIQTSASYATIPGGSGNSAAGTCSFAAGKNAQANDNSSFVWCDGTRAAWSQGANTFTVLATGGIYFYDNTNGSGSVYLAAGASSWATTSDRNVKKNFQPVNTGAVLDKLAAIPIQQWNYQVGERHRCAQPGPMAQDFIGAFYPGRDDKAITTLEFDGVELAAIQGLNQKLEAEVKARDAEIQGLQARLEKLEQIVNTLKDQRVSSTH